MKSITAVLFATAIMVSSVSSYFENCNTGIDRLKQGPINFEYYVNNTLWFTDNSFYREN
jgi:hypothetical protein